jgi:hypothetical protein
MPRPRLPWFKVWVGVTRDAKIVTLSDRLFRVWVELLDAASEQKIRGRFDSYAAAAAIVRRKPAEVRQVAAAGLLDEFQDGIWLHDWQDWQRWRPEDSHPNDLGITHESLRNGTGTTHESRSKIEAPRVERAKKRDVDVDVEGDEERKEVRDTYVGGTALENRAPPTKSSSPTHPGNPRVAETIDAFRALRIDVSMSARDMSAIKHSDAPPQLIAEVYDAVARRVYGDDFMRKRLSVHEAVDWVNGYREQKLQDAWESGDDGPLMAKDG